jgi:hypothetical protein
VNQKARGADFAVGKFRMLVQFAPGGNEPGFEVGYQIGHIPVTVFDRI